MDLALNEAQQAALAGEVPVGAVIVQRRNSEVLAAFSNQMRGIRSSIAHAEMLAIQKAMQVIHNERLIDCDMYVSLEPCPMCAQAISFAARIIYGAPDPKSGGTDHGARVFEHSQTHHRPEVLGGISEAACSTLISNFFKTRRAKS